VDTVNEGRKQLLLDGLRALPYIPEGNVQARNGESLATDEAAVWKRVINYRLAVHLQPATILETHPGLGISTALYKSAAAAWMINKIDDVRGNYPVDLIDIDPFGQPWKLISECAGMLSADGVLQVSNGEALAVRRNLKSAQKFPTNFYGTQMPRWVTKEYLPRLEELTALRVQYFYAFPTTIRAVLSNRRLPEHIWEGCRQWMWWLSRYVKDSEQEYKRMK
jgi:hypothetical protein